MPGQELANHFTEWTYNYHDDKRPWACNVHRYPTPDEQRRFAKAYIEHHAGKPPGGAGTARDDGTATPVPPPMMHATSSSSIVDFMLDSRAPPGGWCAAEKAHEESTDRAARQLLDESRMWRPANSAMWAAWGVVQAKIDDDEGKEGTEEEEEPADEFDYILYAQDRALFFWGDVVQMGLVDAGELPESLRTRLKIVEAGNQ